MKKLVFVFAALIMFASCDSTKVLKTVEEILGGETGGGLSNTQIAAGLKEALNIGIVKGANVVSKTDGYLKNPQIKIPWPSQVQKVANTMQQFGMGGLVGKVETSLNRAAEKAAIEAKPIFLNAIKQLNFQDVMSILQGDQNAATEFLKRTTSSQLMDKFQPIIKNSLNSVNATKYWDDVAKAVDKPIIKQALNVDIGSIDLEQYVTQKALDGLFTMVAKEELKIRKDPVARTTDLLKKVFSLQDNNSSNKSSTSGTKSNTGSKGKELNRQ